ncbi:hypothetical protein BDV95DRAFT_193799 [Massariosphaeria phaeospora]|uniref:Uncharacterized protein n=1 Tax=Massariosphaeria phaeospora TaxID=100035 RepID=A0A7C8M447_9PLEO|nr:hypothetical protein BDV95DRAFT_193799 [Massariosphaeria phaeospora]
MQLKDSHLITRWHNLDAYCQIVEKYNNRQLSFPEDALKAFSAIITAMGRAIANRMLYSLPEVFLNGALLWKTISSAKQRTNAAGNVMKQFPSWSWLGWDTEVDTRLWLLHEYIVDKDDYSKSSREITQLSHVIRLMYRQMIGPE